MIRGRGAISTILGVTVLPSAAPGRRDVDLDRSRPGGPKDTQSRFLIRMLTQFLIRFQYVMSEDGITWSTAMEGNARKVK
jgi:hypothetical protein